MLAQTFPNMFMALGEHMFTKQDHESMSRGQSPLTGYYLDHGILAGPKIEHPNLI